VLSGSTGHCWGVEKKKRVLENYELGRPETVLSEPHRALTELMVSRRKRATAILGSNDMTAIGVIRQAYDRDIKIPADLGLPNHVPI
jgi:DNA-binding LacI/PurR family transcriptional regulator